MFWKKRNSNTHAHAENKSELIESDHVKVVVRSDLGNVRQNNEDMGMFYRVADEQVIREKGCLLMVADGMGGHNAGEVASRMAAETVSHEYFKQKASIEKGLAKAFEQANRAIHQQSATNRSMNGMGTTCTALVVLDQSVYYGHVGDSRAYMLKDGRIHRITEDHTYVQELVSKGEITLAEAAIHPKRNILTNAMGTKDSLRVDTGKFALPFEEKDRLMICSDGLYDYLNDNEIAGILGGNPLHVAAEELVNEAKARGGHDNITVVLAERTPVNTEAMEKETRDFDIPLTKEFDIP
jgi:PPM family protein phosphatase